MQEIFLRSAEGLCFINPALRAHAFSLGIFLCGKITHLRIQANNGHSRNLEPACGWQTSNLKPRTLH